MYTSDNSVNLQVITGCVFAGKTTELLSRLRRAEVAGESVGAVTPRIDDRESVGVIGTHDDRQRDAIVVDEQRPREILNSADGFSVIGIDEGNFFSDGLVDVATELANEGKTVIISGTDQTFRGDPFSPMDKLMAVADDTEKLQAVCTECGSKASRNQKLQDGEPAPASSPTVEVGGEEKYEARCRHCHIVPE